MSKIVLDASVLVALIADEKGSEVVERHSKIASKLIHNTNFHGLSLLGAEPV